MLLLMTAGNLSADTFNINVNFGGGFTGTGSFNTDGICGTCVAGTTLTNFTFTVDEDTFTEGDAVAGRLEYFRNTDTLITAGISAVIVWGIFLISNPPRPEQRSSSS
jgi:hypothetical protein